MLSKTLRVKSLKTYSTSDFVLEAGCKSRFMLNDEHNSVKRMGFSANETGKGKRFKMKVERNCSNKGIYINAFSFRLFHRLHSPDVYLVISTSQSTL